MLDISKAKARHNWNKDAVNFSFLDKIYLNFSEFDLEVMWRIKLFPF